VTDECIESAFLVTSRFSLEVVAMDTPLEVSAVKVSYVNTFICHEDSKFSKYRESTEEKSR